MDEEVESLFEVLISLLQRTHCEIRALCELLIDRKLVSEEHFAKRVENVKQREFSDLKAEVKRRALEKTLSTRRTQ